MLFKSVFALVLLATVVSGRTLTLKDLLKKAINSFPHPNDGPVVSAVNCTAVKEATGLAESVEDISVENSLENSIEPQTKVQQLSSRALVNAAAGEIIGQIVAKGAMKRLIVSLHNELRADVKPPATDMEKMVWDEDLAKYAADWAACGDNFFKHRTGANRVKNYGENLYISMTSSKDPTDLIDEIKNGLKAWWNENEFYSHDSNSCESGKVCGHYTQMAWAKSTKVGCGYALNCPTRGYTNTFYLVCNYSPPGNWVGQKPYTAKPSVGSVVTTFGGTAKGAKCLFPFEYEGESHSECFEVFPGEMPWCKTDNGKWGYCAPEASTPCKDTTPACPGYTRYLQGCPSETHEPRYLYFMKQRCSATCGYCKCAGVTSCQNGGQMEGCACKCEGAWIGGDCGVCLIDECKNGGTFDAGSCSCSCPPGYGGATGGCMDNPDRFNNKGHTFKCSYGWVVTNGLCRCPQWGPELKKHCPITCG
ncbi:hypothetical protein NP493_1614g00018 [Ridgeia piscesae]|uniref:Uncharacterized protein n=1 Tax=Ridgeia piscesae TaxID=27915 RepID=A0AAD9JZC5_RIDPI|nr:hypothetical protein NP493_1614g00018 [Ridgeia piscesae]